MIKTVEPTNLTNYNKYYDDIFDVLNPIDDVNEEYLIFDKNKPSEYSSLVACIQSNCKKDGE